MPVTVQQAECHIGHTVFGMQAGTFEERNVTAWAKEQLAVLLVGLQHSSAGKRVSLTGFTSAAGGAHVWIMRSKKRCALAAWRGVGECEVHCAESHQRCCALGTISIDVMTLGQHHQRQQLRQAAAGPALTLT